MILQELLTKAQNLQPGQYLHSHLLETVTMGDGFGRLPLGPLVDGKRFRFLALRNLTANLVADTAAEVRKLRPGNVAIDQRPGAVPYEMLARLVTTLDHHPVNIADVLPVFSVNDLIASWIWFHYEREAGTILFKDVTCQHCGASPENLVAYLDTTKISCVVVGDDEQPCAILRMKRPLEVRGARVEYLVLQPPTYLDCFYPLPEAVMQSGHANKHVVCAAITHALPALSVDPASHKVRLTTEEVGGFHIVDVNGCTRAIDGFGKVEQTISFVCPACSKGNSMEVDWLNKGF